MPVSSYVVTAESGLLEEAIESVSSIVGVRVGKLEKDSFPAAFSSESEAEAQMRGEEIENAFGVRKALLVYHNFEDVEEYQSRK